MATGGDKGNVNWTSSETAPDSAHDPNATGVRALRLHDIGVAFQPIVDIATGELLGQEALVRCKRPEYEQARTLFERAAAEDACGRLGRMIRDVAFTSCGDVPLFVNIHPSELVARWLVRPDDPIGFHSQPVYIEIPESAAYSHFDLCASALKELCARTGAHLVIDDFCAAYANVERVVQLQPTIVKLDIAVTRDIATNKLQQVVTRDMVTLCKDIKAQSIAEGVETIDELRCLRDLGVDMAQGYLFARPASPPPAPAWPISSRPSKRDLGR